MPKPPLPLPSAIPTLLVVEVRCRHVQVAVAVPVSEDERGGLGVESDRALRGHGERSRAVPEQECRRPAGGNDHVGVAVVEEVRCRDRVHDLTGAVRLRGESAGAVVQEDCE